jgi:hypothetical protein
LGATLAFEDESGFSLVSALKCTWAPRGQTPVIRTQTSHHQRVNALGTLVVTPGGRRLRMLSRLRCSTLNSQRILEFLKKLQRRRRLIKVELQMLWGEWGLLRSRLKAMGLTGRLNTAFIERLNLTLRQGVAMLTRRTWGTAQHMSELALHVEWWRGYYHFARYHGALRTELPTSRPRKGKQLACRYRSQTPPMAAGVTTRRWTVIQLISYPIL